MTEYFKIFGTALAGFYSLIPSFGLAIILLTLLVRVLLLPLSIKQTKSMREMQRIQPEIKKLQAKNKGNRQKMNEELMALYKEHGVNPARRLRSPPSAVPRIDRPLLRHPGPAEVHLGHHEPVSGPREPPAGHAPVPRDPPGLLVVRRDLGRRPLEPRPGVR